MRLRSVVAGALGLGLVATTASALPAQNPRLVAIPPNTAVDLGPYGCTSPAGAGGHCENITDYSGMVYDRHGHRLLMFGGGHAGSSGTIRSDVSAFDFGTLTWTSDYTPTSCADMNVGNIDTTNGAWSSTGHPLARHTYDMLVMLDDPPQMLMATSGAVGGEVCSGSKAPPGFALQTRITGYDPATKKWSYRKTDPGQWDSYSTAELDPVTGATMILGSYGLWAYDAKADAFLGSQFDPTELGYANNLVYARSTDRMYYFSRGTTTRVFELALDRATMQTDPPGGDVGTLAFHEIAFDPVDGVFVFVTNAASGFHVWAYRYAGSPPPAPSASAPLVDAGAPTVGAPSAAASNETKTSAASGCSAARRTTLGDAGVVALGVLLLLQGRRRSVRSSS